MKYKIVLEIDSESNLKTSSLQKAKDRAEEAAIEIVESDNAEAVMFINSRVFKVEY